MPYSKLKAERYQNVKGINQKKSYYETGDNEVIDLVNYSFQKPGAWTKRWGFTNAISGNTLTADRVNALWQDYSIGSDVVSYAATDSKLFRYDFTNSRYASMYTFTNSPVDVNYVEYLNMSFATTGEQFFKVGNAQAAYFGLDDPTVTGVTTAGAGNLTGSYNFQLAFMDAFGFIGPVSATLSISGLAGNSVRFLGITVDSGQTLYAPVNYVIYSDRVVDTSSNIFSVYYDSISNVGITLIWNGAISIGLTNALHSGIEFSAFSDVPDYLGVYNQRLFTLKSGSNLVRYSEPLNPQIIEDPFFYVVNEKYTATGMRFYNQSLLIFLQKGVFRLTGDGIDGNFNNQQITSEYGCISNKSIVVFENRCWFLDDVGIIEYNGANIGTISEPIDDYIKRINFDAVKKACSVHVQDRNEVWFCVPIDGATENNCVLVYDYYAGAWTTYKGFIPTAINQLYTSTTLGILTNEKVFFGSSGGSLYNFGASLPSDNGVATTLMFKTKYHNELGKSNTAQFRRFYLDIGAHSATQVFNISMYSNYSTGSIAMTRSFPIGMSLAANNQNRIDFGIPAKSLSFEVFRNSTTVADQVDGYTVEYRYQRNV